MRGSNNSVHVCSAFLLTLLSKAVFVCFCSGKAAVDFTEAQWLVLKKDYRSQLDNSKLLNTQLVSHSVQRRIMTLTVLRTFITSRKQLSSSVLLFINLNLFFRSYQIFVVCSETGTLMIFPLHAG